LNSKTALPLCFIDARGGETARLGGAVSHALGVSDAIAVASGEEKPLPEDVQTVLEEVGMTAPPAAPFDTALTSKHFCVWLGEGSQLAAGPNTQVWPATLRSPDEPLFDRLVVARQLRDGIAKRIRATSRP
jgi:hypothetical protein